MILVFDRFFFVIISFYTLLLLYGVVHSNEILFSLFFITKFSPQQPVLQRLDFIALKI